MIVDITPWGGAALGAFVTINALGIIVDALDRFVLKPHLAKMEAELARLTAKRDDLDAECERIRGYTKAEFSQDALDRIDEAVYQEILKEHGPDVAARYDRRGRRP
jgi:hypothetical protein